MDKTKLPPELCSTCLTMRPPYGRLFGKPICSDCFGKPGSPAEKTTPIVRQQCAICGDFSQCRPYALFDYACRSCISDSEAERTQTDPKGAAGKLKDQLQLIPTIFEKETARALANGAAKYKPFNWRFSRVESMTYIGAIRRHLNAYFDGEELDPESDAHHLGHIAANCAILLDAAEQKTLIDNRPGCRKEKP